MVTDVINFGNFHEIHVNFGKFEDWEGAGTVKMKNEIGEFQGLFLKTLELLGGDGYNENVILTASRCYSLTARKSQQTEKTNISFILFYLTRLNL